MAQLVLICSRNRAQPTLPPAAAALLAARLTPDGAPLDWRCERGEGLAILVTQAAGSARDGLGAAVGRVIGPPAEWARPGEPAPDGQYALVRADDEVVELVTDALAARTLWYVLDDSRLLAATSLRALIALLGSFEPEPAATPWFLACGFLGPGVAWDRRIRAVPADTVLRLTRAAWTLSSTTRPVEFAPLERPAGEHRERLREVLEASFAALDLDPDAWAISLTGGLDSRYLLARFAARGRSPRCVTYGLSERFAVVGSDGQRAAALASAAGAPFQYFPSDLPDDAATALRDFVAASEGRVDHVQHYADGLAWPRALAGELLRGLVRGDECFGWHPVCDSAHMAQQRVGFTTLADYADADDLGAGRRPEVALSPELAPRLGESHDTYRDRLYQSFRVPCFLAAIAGCVTPYLEVVSPLLCRQVLEVVRTLPDPLRLEKGLFAELVLEAGREVPAATVDAWSGVPQMVRTPGLVDVVRATLRGPGRDAVGEAACDYLLDRLETHGPTEEPARQAGWRAAARRLVKRYAPPAARAAAARLAHRRDANVVAFRVYCITTALALFREDAAWGLKEL